MRSARRAGHRGVSASLFVLCVGLATWAVVPSAWARSEALRWRQEPAGQQVIVGFEALIGPESGVVSRVESLGLPQPDGQGVFASSIVVDDAETVFVALQAIGEGGVRSGPSAWQRRTGSGGGGPTVADLPAVEPVAPEPRVYLRLDFDETDLDDWVQTGANFSLVETSGRFSVSEVAGDRAASTTSSEPDIHAHYAGPGSDSADIILSGRMGSQTSTAGFGVTAYSQYPSEDAYYRLRTRGDGSVFEIAPYPDPDPDPDPDSSIECRDASTGVIARVGVWYRFELAVDSREGESVISATVWPEGGVRPTRPQAECSDGRSTRPMSGKIGLWSSGAGERFWDDLQVISSDPTTDGAEGSFLPPAAPSLIFVKPAS